MSNHVTISTLGSAAAPGAPEVGEEAVERMIDFWEGQFKQVLPDRPDLILVPECCDQFAGHSPEQCRAWYSFRGRRIADYFARVAAANRCYVAYPAYRELPDGTWRNSLELFDRDGQSLGWYNKNYPVITENTESGVLSGREASLFRCDFGTVGAAICFDLNFAGIRLKYVESKPDLILFASMYHGGLMQAYWAYSCRTHLVTAIRNAPSGIVSPVGTPVATTTNYFHYVTAVVNLDCVLTHLDFNWPKLTAMKKKYGPNVRVFDPGFLGSVLISSESDEFTCDDLVTEFGLERLDDYLQRSRTHAENPDNMEPA